MASSSKALMLVVVAVILISEFAAARELAVDKAHVTSYGHIGGADGCVVCCLFPPLCECCDAYEAEAHMLEEVLATAARNAVPYSVLAAAATQKAEGAQPQAI